MINKIVYTLSFILNSNLLFTNGYLKRIVKKNLLKKIPIVLIVNVSGKPE